MIYEMSPRAYAAADQARMMLRDGISRPEVAKTIGLPGVDDEEMALMLDILLTVEDLGGTVEIGDEA